MSTPRERGNCYSGHRPRAPGPQGRTSPARRTTRRRGNAAGGRAWRGAGCALAHGCGTAAGCPPRPAWLARREQRVRLCSHAEGGKTVRPSKKEPQGPTPEGSPDAGRSADEPGEGQREARTEGPADADRERVRGPGPERLEQVQLGACNAVNVPGARAALSCRFMVTFVLCVSYSF